MSLDTYKNLTPGFLLLSNYLLLSPDPFLLLFTPPPPPRHDWDVERSEMEAALVVGINNQQSSHQEVRLKVSSAKTLAEELP